MPLVCCFNHRTFRSTESYASAALDESAVVSTLERAMAASKVRVGE